MAEGPCIEFEGTRNDAGYGVLSKPVHGSRIASRAALAEKLGRPVNGFTRHNCDNPPCVNPDHLLEGTRQQNAQDMVERGRAKGQYTDYPKCKWGHEFSPENTKIYPRPDGVIERRCLTCRRRRNKEQAARRKSARQRARI